MNETLKEITGWYFKGCLYSIMAFILLFTYLGISSYLLEFTLGGFYAFSILLFSGFITLFLWGFIVVVFTLGKWILSKIMKKQNKKDQDLLTKYDLVIVSLLLFFSGEILMFFSWSMLCNSSSVPPIEHPILKMSIINLMNVIIMYCTGKIDDMSDFEL